MQSRARLADCSNAVVALTQTGYLPRFIRPKDANSKANRSSE